SKLTTELWRSVDTAIAFAALLGVFLATTGEYVHADLDDFLLVRLTLRNVLLLSAFFVVWPLLFSGFGLYDATRLRTPREEALRVAGACTLVAATTALLLPGGGSDA